MDDRQLTGVLAHELSHVANRDTLVGTIAATIAAAISWLAQMAQLQMLFGGDDEGGSPIGVLAAAVLAPIAALVIQLAVSRNREYLADSSGARLTGDPEGLAQALEKLGAASRDAGLLARIRTGRGRRSAGDDRRTGAPAPALDPAFASLYIASPFGGAEVASLFSTHPPIETRVARLHALRGTPAAARSSAVR
jgi:heat shock protein HtpX